MRSRAIKSQQTTLGRLLQNRREAAGYSRTRIAEIVGIKAGTIEGWELGRVAKPPIHDVLRLASFLRISADDIQAAVLREGEVPRPARVAEDRSVRHGAGQAAVPLLEAAFTLFGWSNSSAAAEALSTSPEQLERWRTGAERMELSDYLTLSSMIGLAAAAAMKGDDARIADLEAAAETLGVASQQAGALAVKSG